MFAGLPMQWYSSPKRAITAGSYRLRPSNTTGVRSTERMPSKSGVRNSFHSVTMASASARYSAAAAESTIDRPGTSPITRAASCAATGS